MVYRVLGHDGYPGDCGAKLRTFRPIHAKIIDDAVRADPSIAYYQDEIMEAPGSTPEYLESLGLTKHLMK